MGRSPKAMALKFLAAVCLACCAGVAWAADPAAPDSYIIDFNTDIKGATLVSMAINRSMAPPRRRSPPRSCQGRILRWCFLLPRRARLRGSVRYRWHARNERQMDDPHQR